MSASVEKVNRSRRAARRQFIFEVLCLSTGRTFHKSLAWLSIVLLGAGLANATTRPTHHKNKSSRSAVANSSHTAKAHVKLVSSRTHRHSKPKSKRVRGQQVIDGSRAREIQTALVREGYMSGEPSGVWDQETKDAMARYQSDHGWQTKTLPDSRALIALGLGPSHADAINAETASAPARVEPIKNSAVPEAH